jgi:Mrp family chromosome partitioning ATPase
LSPILVTADRVATKASPPTGADDGGGEEMLRLVQRMFLSTDVSAPRQVVFCGVGSENGSSSVCAGVAKTLAVNHSRSVCLVDANLRSPRLSGLFGIRAANSLLRKSASVHEQLVEVGENLWLAGPGFLAGDGGTFPSAAKLKELFAELREGFESVLIDAPGADISGDPAILGQVADGTVLVIDADSTRRIAARKAKESLDAAHVRLLGTVLYNRSFPIPKRLYDRL